MNGQPVAKAVGFALPISASDRLSVLFDTHHDRLYRLARRLVPNAEDALDLVQEAFLKAARSPQSVPFGASNEEAWLVRVLINIRRDQWRKEVVRRRHDREINRSTVINDEEGALIARAAVWRALDTLTPRRRAVLVMHELDGLGVPAIASLLGVSAVTVRWHLARGRRDLARTLRPQMGETNESR